MAEKKGLLERIFGKKDSECCCCGPKIVPKDKACCGSDEKEEKSD
jgi:hypothetical protein